jgi:hypothetical protein
MKNGDDLHQIVAHGMDHQARRVPHPRFRIESRSVWERGYGGDRRIDARGDRRAFYRPRSLNMSELSAGNRVPALFGDQRFCV